MAAGQHRQADQMHAFFQMPNILPAAREAIDWIAAFLDTQVFDTETESAR